MNTTSARLCTRTGCQARAVATLTYVYAESIAVLGPLSPDHTPGSYHLCRSHAASLSVPRGWEVIRLPDVPDTPPAPQGDDLLALADAVREVGLRHDEVPPPGLRPDPVEVAGAGEPGAQVVVLAEHRRRRMAAEGGERGRDLSKS